MSWRVMHWVQDESTARGPQFAVLMALARSANDDGTGAHPGIRVIQHRTRLCRSQVYATLRSLIDSGQIKVSRPGGRGAGDFVTYSVVMDAQRVIHRDMQQDELGSGIPDGRVRESGLEGSGIPDTGEVYREIQRVARAREKTKPSTTQGARNATGWVPPQRQPRPEARCDHEPEQRCHRCDQAAGSRPDVSLSELMRRGALPGQSDGALSGGGATPGGADRPGAR